MWQAFHPLAQCGREIRMSGSSQTLWHPVRAWQASTLDMSSLPPPLQPALLVRSHRRLPFQLASSLRPPYKAAGPLKPPSYDGNDPLQMPSGATLSAYSDGVFSGVKDNCLAEDDQGTSMAAPAVAGAAAIVRQYFIEGFYPTGKSGGVLHVRASKLQEAEHGLLLLWGCAHAQPSPHPFALLGILPCLPPPHSMLSDARTGAQHEVKHRQAILSRHMCTFPMRGVQARRRKAMGLRLRLHW